VGRVTKRRGGGSWPARALVGVTAVGALGIPAGVGAEPTTGLLPSVACDRYEDLKAIDDRMVPPGVFELDRDEVAALQAERRALVRHLAGRTTGDLEVLLSDMLLWQSSFDAALVDSWDDERERLAREGWTSWDWRGELVDDGEVQDRDGEEVRYQDVSGYYGFIDQRLAVECYAPELADGPPVDTSDDPPEGRILIHRVDDGADDFRGALVTVSTTGEGERRLRREGYASIGHYDVGPDGDVAVTAAEGDGWRLVVVDPTGVVQRFVRTPLIQPACPAWDDGGRRLLLTDNYAANDERDLHLVDIDGDVRRLDLPFAVTGCSDFLGDDRLVVADAATELDGPRGVWTVGLDGSDPEEVYAPEGCTTQVGDVDPLGTRVAVAQSCEDVLDTSLVVVDLADGGVTPVATGFASLPRWSGDGEWLAFGFGPLGQQDPFSAYIAKADGTQLRPLVEGHASFPNWLPG
jgi:hypothetical protein